jgi:hypothetical protein
MRRFLHTLARLGSPARRVSRAAPAARPGLEILEARDVPTVHTSNTDILDARQQALLDAVQSSTLNVRQQPPAIIFADPYLLVGRSVTLGQPGNPSNQYGVLTVTSVTWQADGSYSFTGEYVTKVNDITIPFTNDKAFAVVKGTFGPPQYSAYFTSSTCTVQFDGTAYGLTHALGGAMSVQDKVHFSGTVSLSVYQAQASLSGQLLDCLEDMDGQPLFGCRTVPASGTFM